MPLEKRPWTVLVYFAGDINLSEMCVDALQQMKWIGSTEGKFHAVAQFDPNGKNAPAHRYYLRKGGDLRDDEISHWEPTEIDMADPHTLLDFLRWGIREYPADHYLVALSGHASGINDDYL